MRTISLRRRLPPSSKVLLGLAAGCALAAFALVHAQGARAASQGRSDVTVQVVVAAHDLAAGLDLTEDDVQMQSVPEAGEPPGALTSVTAATGRVPTGRIAAGEVLTLTRVATSLLSGSVPFGDVAVTVTFASVPDGLTVADRVDAYATFGGARPFTTLAGEDLRVLRIGTSDGAGPRPGPRHAHHARCRPGHSAAARRGRRDRFARARRARRRRRHSISIPVAVLGGSTAGTVRIDSPRLRPKGTA